VPASSPTSQELLRGGRLTEALAALQMEIRLRPEDPRLRVFLFQFNCVLGRWEKALDQLQVVAALDAEMAMLAQIFRPVIACELFRRDVFTGKRTALIFGDPPEWVGAMVQALALQAAGNTEAAAALRDQAFAASPSTPGTLEGAPFDWIADADGRLGPLLEVILDGKYYWIPFARIRRIVLEKPTDLRDLVWAPARFTWTNGGAASGHIPVRYPGTEDTADDSLRLGRRTEWKEVGPNYQTGLGQRLLVTDAGDYPLLDCRTIDFSPPL